MSLPFARASVGVLLVGMLAGCAGTVQDDQGDPNPGGQSIDTGRPDPSFGPVQTGPAVGPDLNATTEAAPRLVEGEWWRIRFRSNFTGVDDVEYVRVVANATPAGYVIGMPHEGWYKEAISYHAPAFGDVALNLSYQTHNEWFQPVRFPLREGDTWPTSFAGRRLDAVVERVDGRMADVAFYAPASTSPTAPVMQALMPSSPGPAMRITYDAGVHEVVKMVGGIGDFEVVAHGYDFQGWVTVPRGEHTAIDYGTFGPVTPGGPVLAREVVVDGGFNRLTMMHVVMGMGPGMYRLTSVPPEGEPFVTELVGSGMLVRFYEATSPDGVWQQEDLVGGPGATYSMGIAYHQYDIQVPNGARRADHAHEVIR